MVVRSERRAAMRYKRHHLRTLTCSKSVKKKYVSMDALLCIYKLKLKLEAVKRELSDLIAIKRECLKELQLPKGGDKLVSILEVFEEMGLTVSHARVSCNVYLSMEAIVLAEEERALHVKSIAQAITKAIERQ
ncbi:hypothetical protein SADUNF_Sadunf11G0045900 [Salix dunnii]|uniref:Plant bHLH transcription factor ACT-like domain-containing protein n=1 Tax=Salix dunnii TaxID=1413687 RepID=A0A835JQ16_9ROSI|nr:hypothetical protein SADUNF_Sadunf11G0045900 [Salix dunnii]